VPMIWRYHCLRRGRPEWPSAVAAPAVPQSPPGTAAALAHCTSGRGLRRGLDCCSAVETGECIMFFGPCCQNTLRHHPPSARSVETVACRVSRASRSSMPIACSRAGHSGPGRLSVEGVRSPPCPRLLMIGPPRTPSAPAASRPTAVRPFFRGRRPWYRRARVADLRPAGPFVLFTSTSVCGSSRAGANSFRAGGVAAVELGA